MKTAIAIGLLLGSIISAGILDNNQIEDCMELGHSEEYCYTLIF